MVRLVARFHKGGAESITHRGRNKPSPRKLPQEQKDKILFLVNAYYSDYSAVFAAESLQKYHDLTIHPEALRRLLKPSKQRKMKKHRQWRERKRHYGEMIQVDGSLHNWFEERGPQLFPKNIILVQEKFDGTIRLFIRSQRLNFVEITQKPEKVSQLAKKKIRGLWFPDVDSLFCGTLIRFT